MGQAPCAAPRHNLNGVVPAIHRRFSSKNSIAKQSNLGMLADMDWQEAIALAIVVITTAAFVRAKVRPGKFRFQRDSHCGCSAPTSSRQPPSVLLRARKGQRAVVTVKY